MKPRFTLFAILALVLFTNVPIANSLDPPEAVTENGNALLNTFAATMDRVVWYVDVLVNDTNMERASHHEIAAELGMEVDGFGHFTKPVGAVWQAGRYQVAPPNTYEPSNEAPVSGRL